MENIENKINFSDINTMEEYKEYIRQTSAAWYRRNAEYKKQYAKAYYQKKKLEEAKKTLKNKQDK